MLLSNFREQARLNRGVLLAAPVFWSSFCVFLNPVYGIAGFAIHFFLCLPKKKTGGFFLVFAFALFSLWFSARYPSLTLERVPLHRNFPSHGDFRFWTGKVANFPVHASNGGYSFLLSALEGIFRASALKGRTPAIGATILLLARQEDPELPMNPGQFDPRSLLRTQGAVAFLRMDNWIELKPPPLWHRWLAEIRTRLEWSLEQYVPGSARPLILAALLNETADVSSETQQDFTRSGMQHILAISGQHIGLLAAFLLFPALCLRLPRKLAFALTALVTAVYIPVTGSPVSVARAGFMLACFLPSVFLERPASALNIFFLTLAVDLILSPFHILNLGFQLSYAATLALILSAKPSLLVKNRFKPTLVGVAAQMVFLSTLVTLFVYPVLAVSIHAMAPWSLLGNLATIPISSGMLIAGLCTWTFSPFPFLAHAAGACAGLCSLLLESSVHFLAKLPGALWPIAQPNPVWIFFWIAMSLVTTVLFQMKRFKHGFLTLALLVSVEIFRPALSAAMPETARITVLSVGHGDASVMELPGATVLIDAGPSPRVAQQILIPFLQSRGIRRLDRLVLTHPDMDHYGGAFALLDRVSIGAILTPPLSSTDASWRCLRREAEQRGIPWKEARAGDLLYQKGGVSLLVLSPDSSLDSASDNNHSLVCLLQTKHEKALFTGDIEGPAQLALAGTWPLWRNAWLKAPHHGSDRTTLPCFLTAASASRVAISSGHRPGFPGRTTLETFGNLHTKVSVTARTGAVTWEFGRDTARCRNFRGML